MSSVVTFLTRCSPGDQYNSGNVTNPFEERVVNGFTAVEIATLQSRLNKQLGPEYISQRPGNGGGRVAYLEGNKAIALANEVFGFNGWSSSLGQVQIDYVGVLKACCRDETLMNSGGREHSEWQSQPGTFDRCADHAQGWDISRGKHLVEPRTTWPNTS